jgi:hypothetical protein
MVIRWEKEKGHSMGKGEDAWWRGRVEAMKKRRCIVVWTSGVLVFGVWSLFAFCYLFFVISGRGGDEKTMVIRWERESNGHSMGKGEDAWLRGRVEAKRPFKKVCQS